MNAFDDVLAAAQAGAEWAVARLYADLQPSVLRFAAARLGQDADDVTSQVWLEVARGLRGFSGDEAAFRRWVFTIAHRRIANAIRSRMRNLSTPVPVEELRPMAADSAEDEAARAASGDEAARIIANALPPDLAEVVLLRVVAGLSAEEVAEVTGRKPGTVRVMQHRALKRLRAALNENLPGGVTR